MVIPWFLIPGRPYPVQVYLFACELYSSVPEIGQRGAAKATRAKFKLDTFSHSTVSRSFKSFEKAHKLALEKRFGEEAKVFATEGPAPIRAAASTDIKAAEGARSERRFPSAADTAMRRGNMAKFFPKYHCGAKRSDIESTSSQFVKGWHEKTMRMLL